MGIISSGGIVRAIKIQITPTTRAAAGVTKTVRRGLISTSTLRVTGLILSRALLKLACLKPLLHSFFGNQGVRRPNTIWLAKRITIIATMVGTPGMPPVGSNSTKAAASNKGPNPRLPKASIIAPTVIFSPSVLSSIRSRTPVRLMRSNIMLFPVRGEFANHSWRCSAAPFGRRAANTSSLTGSVLGHQSEQSVLLLRFFAGTDFHKRVKHHGNNKRQKVKHRTVGKQCRKDFARGHLIREQRDKHRFQHTQGTGYMSDEARNSAHEKYPQHLEVT